MNLEQQVNDILTETSELVIGDAYGVYSYSAFLEAYELDERIDDADYEALKGDPYGAPEWYHDAWTDLENTTTVDGKSICQMDGGIFLIDYDERDRRIQELIDQNPDDEDEIYNTTHNA